MSYHMGYTCPVCHVWVQSGAAHSCVQTQPLGVWPLATIPGMGCICPPGANLTCEAPHCPRKAPKVA